MPQDDFIPLILLFLFGGFAVLSALLKTRARVKALLSVGLIVLEGLAGFALMAAALPTSGSLEAASRMGIIAAVVVALSSTVHVVKVRERSRAREASEGKRLYASIRYGIDTSAILAEDEPLEPEAPVELEDASGHLGGADGGSGDDDGDPGDPNDALG